MTSPTNNSSNVITPARKPEKPTLMQAYKNQVSDLFESTIENLNMFATKHPMITASVVTGLILETCWILRNPQLLSDRELAKQHINGLKQLVSASLSTALVVSQIMTMKDVLDPHFIDLQAPHRNLTLKAQKGQLFPMVGREQIVQQVVAILACSDKPNVLLVGSPGVGKTAIAEGLALYLSKNKIENARFNDVRIIEVKATEFMSGAGILGQFEQRIEQFIFDLEKATDIIVFIDEIHSLLNVGSGSTNARDILKPMLARGKARIIGCTTTAESTLMLNDGAFNRRFQRIDIPEPRGDILKNMVCVRTQQYADTHGCFYTHEAIEAAIQLTQEFHGFYPDKALTVLDQAGAGIATQIHRAGEVKVVTVAVVRKVVEQLNQSRKPRPNYFL